MYVSDVCVSKGVWWSFKGGTVVFQRGNGGLSKGERWSFKGGTVVFQRGNGGPLKGVWWSFKRGTVVFQRGCGGLSKEVLYCITHLCWVPGTGDSVNSLQLNSRVVAALKCWRTIHSPARKAKYAMLNILKCTNSISVSYSTVLVIPTICTLED